MTTAFFRTVILYLILMIGLRLMGKRQIGELEPSELVLTLIISDLASVPMQNYGIPLVNGLFPITILLCLSMMMSFFNLKSVRFRGLICGHPTVIVENGQVLQKNMEKNRFTIDELFEQLRSQGISDLRTVKYAVLETSGQVSILPYTQSSPITADLLDLAAEDTTTLPILLINDGHIMKHNLKGCGYDLPWLTKQLTKRGFSSPQELFFLAIDENGTVTYAAKEEKK